MSLDEETIRHALKTVRFPGFSRDIVSFGLVRSIAINDGDKVSVSLAVTTGKADVPRQIKAEVEETLRQVPGVGEAFVQIAVSAPKTPPPPSQAQGAATGDTAQGGHALQKVKYTVAIASGKGGVGKSTFAVNLACALEQLANQQGRDNRIGLMDCDIYGPSVPLMIGVSGRPEVVDEAIQPLSNFGVRVMSMGLLIDEETPVVWRGPMIMKTIQQFAQNVDWGDLDILIIDLPPGTGDAQLSLVQTIPLDGAVVVTTPQTAAVNVARRGAGMFEKVNVDVLGVAENMSYFALADGTRQHIFGQGGGRKTAQALKTAFLGEVPIDPAIREGGDRGIPVVVADPEGASATAFRQIAEELLRKLEKK